MLRNLKIENGSWLLDEKKVSVCKTVSYNEIILFAINQKSQKPINSHNLLNQNFSLVSINPIRKEFGA